MADHDRLGAGGRAAPLPRRRLDQLRQIEDADVAAAQAFFFTDAALTVMDETCTVLEWALVEDERGDKTSLKTTFAFGTKGNSDIAEADDWASQYNSRKSALINSKYDFIFKTKVLDFYLDKN
mgnify:CR=1 FL=1